ncbi:MAG TPA: hypothetical protein PLD25_27245 [Chloroflexota bacterium]|nr:hypothetical protein [Chloroflexota bacterium]HUM69253.1 hypothetical protein [Chloroflexota bacterium]
MAFSSTYFMLEQEGFITSSCITTGLTALHTAHSYEDFKGRFYVAFFQLAIGIERTAKLCLILDHMTKHNLSSPGKTAIKGYGHDINHLFDKISQVGGERGDAFKKNFQLTGVQKDILDFLSEFARSTRYANIDGLATGIPGKEPLARWQEILDELININFSAKKKKEILKQSSAIADCIGSHAVVIAHDLKNQPLSLGETLANHKLLDRAAGFAVWEVCQIIRPIVELINRLFWEARKISIQKSIDQNIVDIPHMDEFYLFLNEDLKSTLRKKRWP